VREKYRQIIVVCEVFLAFLCFASFVSILTAAPQGSAGSGYHVVRKLPLGGEGRWDYLTVDPEARRIYISRSTHVMVVDEDSGKVVGDIPDTKGVHGIALASDLGKGYTSNGDAASVTIFDLKTLKPISTVKTTGQNPDSILYDPETKRVFTFNGRSANATAIDATTEKVVGTVALGGKPETPVLDGKGSIFVNIESKNSLAEFDAKTLAVKHTYPLAGCKGPSGIAMDTATRRVFIGCSDSNVMAVVNADTGKVIATPKIAEDTDASRFDPETQLAFASCENGTLSVVHEDSPDKFSVVANVKTQDGARTMALDTKTHHVFVVTADMKPAPPPTKEEPDPRRPIVPGTFVVLELAP
jgi:DNA-binding beta-propeller fold protein YncE